MAGYSYRRIFDIDQGLPPDKKLFCKTDGNRYDLSTFVQRWVNYQIEQNQQDFESLEAAKAVHEQVKIQKTQLEVARMRGELVDVNDVRRLWANIANTVVQNMIRLPTKIGQQVYMLDNLDLVIGIIDKEIRDVLENIADTPLPTEAAVKEDETDNEED